MSQFNLPNSMPNFLGGNSPGGVQPLSNPGTSVSQGTAPMQQGYAQALQQLQNSLSASQNTTSGQQMQLQQQLKQNQGKTQQGLINSGLGQSTVAQTMQQAPLQTYNQGMANVADQGALRSMGAFDQLAGMYAQGGNQMSNYLMPFLQSNILQGQVQQQQAQQQSQMSQANAQQGMQNFLHPQQNQLTQAQLQQLIAAQMAMQQGQGQGQQQAAPQSQGYAPPSTYGGSFGSGGNMLTDASGHSIPPDVQAQLQAYMQANPGSQMYTTGVGQ